jgi:hypothetical protein
MKPEYNEGPEAKRVEERAPVYYMGILYGYFCGAINFSGFLYRSKLSGRDLDLRIFSTVSRAIPGCSIDLCCVRTTPSARVRLRKSARSTRVCGPLLQTR